MASERLKAILLRTALPLCILAGLLAVFVNLASLRCFNVIFDATCSVATTRNVVAITFSDGPSDGTVAQVLPVLAKYDAKATFFLSGQKLERALPTAQRIIAAGHELGNMGYSNLVMEDRPQSFHADEIARTDALLREAGAETPRYFRPPFGIRSVGLLWELHRARYSLIMWSVSDSGRREAPHQAYASAILAQTRPGSIIMLHALGANDDEARAALPLILAGLAERGLQSVTISELLAARGK